MKTYLFSIPERLRNKSEELDVQAIICDKSWEVFNDDGTKQVFIFLPDGTLVISVDGEVTNSTWKYIPANKSLLITAENRTMMLHPAFIDEVVFALQVDGKDECVFMINENNRTKFKKRTLQSLKSYFSKKIKELKAEQARLIASEEENRKLKEQKRLRMEDEENRRAQEELRRKEMLKDWFERCCKNNNRKRLPRKWGTIPFSLFGSSVISAILLFFSKYDVIFPIPEILFISSVLTYVVGLGLVNSFEEKWRKDIEFEMEKMIRQSYDEKRLFEVWERNKTSWFRQKETARWSYKGQEEDK